MKSSLLSLILLGLGLGLGGMAQASTDYEAFRALVLERGRSAPSVIEYNARLDRYELHGFTPESFRRATEMAPDSACLENRHFKLVEFKPLDESDRPRGLAGECLGIEDFDGRNALFHLTKAAQFFERLAGPDSRKRLQQIMVRVRADRMWSRPDHFGLRGEFNNAHYFPADAQGRWGAEIWFLKPRASMRWQGLLRDAGWAAGPHTLVALPFVLPLALERNTDIGMDSVKVPSIIYHEACHWFAEVAGALPASAFSQPLGDAFADYFAASLHGAPRVGSLESFIDSRYAKNLARVRLVTDRRARGSARAASNEFFAHEGSPLVPSLLWSIRAVLGGERTDRLAWRTLLELGESPKFVDFRGALLDALSGEATPQEYESIREELARPEITRSLENLDYLNSLERFKSGINHGKRRSVQ